MTLDTIQGGGSPGLRGDEPTGVVAVVGRRTSGAGVIVLDLQAPDGSPLPGWQPGAHIELRLPTTAGELRRQYSLCGNPQDRTTWRIAILREPDGRGGSDHVHQHLHVGQDVAFSGPRNHFALADSPSYLFVSGGIGITPILPMVQAAQAAGQDWNLVHGCRSADRLVFAQELAELPADRVRIHLDDVDGLLDLDAMLDGVGNGTRVYACGPQGLLDALATRSETAGWTFVCEQFSSPAAVPGQEERAFDVLVASTQDTHHIPTGRSVLAVLNEAGLDLAFSCSEGECGSCEVGVLDGVPDHRDIVLSREEKAANNCFMPCVSRSHTERLVLDL